jgi:predicted MPP superfamily phosphohydrolase
MWSLYASYVPKVTQYSVDIQAPHDWHGKKIIMIADTHYGNIYDVDDARKLVEKINTLSGEVVIIPGDFFDGPIIDF